MNHKIRVFTRKLLKFYTMVDLLVFRLCAKFQINQRKNVEVMNKKPIFADSTFCYEAVVCFYFESKMAITFLFFVRFLQNLV